MITTSYFANKKYGDKGVSIARYCKFWKGETYPDLYPPEKLLTWWNSLTEQEKDTSEARWIYTSHYYKETLDKLDVHKVAKDLEGKVLLCYEGKGKFCHRHLIADWLKSSGYIVQEL